MYKMKTVTENIVYPQKLLQKPFFELTVEMLDCVRDHDFQRLSTICDDDFGIVDINTEGNSELIKNRGEWEKWFKTLFKQLKDINALTWSEITDFESVKGKELGYSVVYFDQILVIGSKKMKYSVVATIIWKLVDSEWKEARYHSSLTGVEEVRV